ncbi:c-type cytochrome biogenesis protein CcmI [Stappia sp.]|uniref:c-type cytochrome biogenesis protein CcmI n=1 Tax=Stappia sp. TaxID=1870903 RepID=UPI003A98DCBB
MVIWIVFSVLTALSALAVLVPVTRARKQAASAAAHDAEVYKAQLAEVDRDLDRGLVSQQAADAARTEIARRLIAANREVTAEGDSASVGDTAPATSARFRLRFAQVIAILIIPVAALLFYLEVGSPDLPDLPLQARLEAPATGRSLPELVARVERELAKNPSDGRGWDVLAPVYMRLGRAEDAAAAYASAIRLLGSDVRRETDMGEAMVIANSGIVGADARAAFERAVKLDPTAVKPRFFLALALTQENRSDDAISAWKALLADARGGEAWAEAVRIELSKLGVEVETPGAPAVAGAPGPDREQVAAAAAMSNEDRTAMIRGMVDQLDTRLTDEGGTPEEWLRLIRALSVLGDAERLGDTVARARVALKDDPEAVAEVERAAQELGIGAN